MTDKEAADVLRFLLNWYTDYEKTTRKVTIPLNAETITEINKELSPPNLKKTTTTEGSRNVADATEVLEARASKMAIEFEKYLEEDYQDYLNGVNNQTSRENFNTTSSGEYDYYYYYDDDDQNVTDSKEHLNETYVENINATITSVEHPSEPPNATESNEISKNPESVESNLKENDDSNAVEIPLYDYVDDNYEAKAFNKEEIKLGKIDVNEYVDDNYETNKNEVPAELKRVDDKKTTSTTLSTVESYIPMSTTEYNKMTKGNEIFEKSLIKANEEITTQTFVNQITTDNEKNEFYSFEKSTESAVISTESKDMISSEKTVLNSIPTATTPVVVITESTTDLNFMIKDIEKHTKSVATNIVMPSYNYSTPIIHTKIEEELKTSTQMPTVKTTLKEKNDEAVLQSEKVIENVSVIPKVIKTTSNTRTHSRGRGRSRFSVVPLSENENAEDTVVTSPKNIGSEVTRSFKSRSRNRFKEASPSTHVVEGEIFTLTTQNVTEDATTDLQEITSPVLPITEIVTEFSEEYDSQEKSEEIFIKKETPSNLITIPTENPRDDILFSSNRDEFQFSVSTLATPEIEEIQIKEDILPVTTTQEVIKVRSDDNISRTNLPENKIILNKEEIIIGNIPTTGKTQITGHTARERNKDTFSTSSESSINFNSSDSDKHSLKTTQTELLLTTEETSQIPIPSDISLLNETSKFKDHDVSTSVESEDGKDNEGMPHISTTEKLTRILSRSRTRNHFNRNNTPSTPIVLLEREESNRDTSKNARNHNFYNRRNSITLLGERKEKSDDILVEISSTTEASTKEKTISTKEDNFGNRKIVEVNAITIPSQNIQNGKRITSYTNNNVSSSNTVNITFNDVPSTTEEILTTIITPEIDHTIFNKRKYNFQWKLNDTSKQNARESKNHTPKKNLNIITIIDTSTITTSGLTEEPEVTTEELLTTINVPKDETAEEMIATTAPNVDSQKPLIDVLGYSDFNKLSENEDDSLRELSDFTIPSPRTTETTRSTKAYNVRGRGRHRFNVASSTVLLRAEEKSTTEGIFTTTITKNTDIPNTSISTSSGTISALAQNEEAMTTDEVLTTITTSKIPESTTTTTNFLYRRRGGHRFHIVPTTNLQNEDVTIDEFSTLITITPNVAESQPEVFRKVKLDQLLTASSKPHLDDVAMTEQLPTTISPPKLIEVTSFRSKVKGRHRFSVIPENTTTKLKDKSKDKIVTDPSLIRSANPTLPRNNFKSTTPITRIVKIKTRKEKLNKKYMFTCLDKTVNRFYSDPRDCRLFHYCSPGYNSNQLVDMKFVCDLGTYYDDAKRICSKEKPARCV